MMLTVHSISRRRCYMKYDWVGRILTGDGGFVAAAPSHGGEIWWLPNTWLLGPKSPHCKRHLDWLSHFELTTQLMLVINRQIDHSTMVTVDHILCYAMRFGLCLTLISFCHFSVLLWLTELVPPEKCDLRQHNFCATLWLICRSVQFFPWHAIFGTISYADVQLGLALLRPPIIFDQLSTSKIDCLTGKPRSSMCL